MVYLMKFSFNEIRERPQKPSRLTSSLSLSFSLLQNKKLLSIGGERAERGENIYVSANSQSIHEIECTHLYCIREKEREQNAPALNPFDKYHQYSIKWIFYMIPTMPFDVQ
jgi:hypothetical protein